MPRKDRVPLVEHRAYQVVLAIIVISQIWDLSMRISDGAGWDRITWEAVQVVFFTLVLVISISDRMKRDRQRSAR